MYRFVAGVLALFCVVSCKALRPVVEDSTVSRATSAGADASTPNKDDTASIKQWLRSGQKVMSVLLEAKGSVEDTKWQRKSTQIYDGYVKKGSSIRYQGYYAAYFVDAAGNRMDSAFFENPLLRRIEAPASDDGKLVTNFQKRAEGVAFVRANYKEEITELHIYTAEGKQTAILNLKNINKK